MESLKQCKMFLRGKSAVVDRQINDQGDKEFILDCKATFQKVQSHQANLTMVQKTMLNVPDGSLDVSNGKGKSKKNKKEKIEKRKKSKKKHSSHCDTSSEFSADVALMKGLKSCRTCLSTVEPNKKRSKHS